MKPLDIYLSKYVWQRFAEQRDEIAGRVVLTIKNDVVGEDWDEQGSFCSSFNLGKDRWDEDGPLFAVNGEGFDDRIEVHVRAAELTAIGRLSDDHRVPEFRGKEIMFPSALDDPDNDLFAPCIRLSLN